MARITYRKTRKGETITMYADKGEDLRGVVAETAKPVDAKPPTFPHTLTSDQFAIISIALDNARERQVACVDRHADNPTDRLNALDDLKAVDELRKLWAFSGPIVLTARRST